jgi:hypothetical protein
MKPYILTEHALTVFDDQPYVIHAEDSRFEQAIEHLRDHDWESLLGLIKPTRVLKQYVSSSGELTMENDVLRYKGEEVHNYIANRIIDLASRNLPFEPLANFLERILKNPSYRARNELYGFLEYGDLPITPDGYFLAYKKINDDYKDCHTGSIDNSVGQTVEMPRESVDDDSNRTCSAGLHFCSLEYLNGFWGTHTMVLKIDPADVVSIPTDYNNTKGRCCRYQVVGEIEQEITVNNYWKKPVVDEYEPRCTDPDSGDDVDDTTYDDGYGFPCYTD